MDLPGNRTFQRFSRFRRRSKLQVFFKERLHAEVRHGRAKEHRCQFPFLYFFFIKRIAGFIKKFQITFERFNDFRSQIRFDCFVINLAGDNFELLDAVGIVLQEQVAHFCLPVINPV